jgi:hypothetical protein
MYLAQLENPQLQTLDFDNTNYEWDTANPEDYQDFLTVIGEQILHLQTGLHPF